MTLKSMTGFGRSSGVHEETSWHWEVRSVNGRGLELRFRMPSGLEGLEIKARSLAQEMLARGTWLVATLAAVKNILRGWDEGQPGIPEYVIEKSRRVYERHRESFKAFYKAGGKLAMGTDAGTPFNRHGENAMELEYMADLGCANRDALHAATASAADLMRRSDLGRLADGKAADILVVDGNPLADIKRAARKENHRLVIKRGIVARRLMSAGSPP